METVEEFLAAIEARPADASLRAVFSDWLMDLGDVRGELIALEESARGLLPTSDAYWKDKAKRDTLRQAVRAVHDGPTFLRLLGYGDRYEPVLQCPQDGWRDRWRLIRELTIRWFGVSLPDVGQRSHQRLSSSVAEWIAFAQDLPPRVLSAVEQIASPGLSAGGWPDDSVVALAGMGNGAYVVRRQALGEDDPPVVTANAFFDDSEALFQTVTEFALMTMLHAAFLGGSSKRGRTTAERPHDLLLRLPGGVRFGAIVVAEGRGWIAFADHNRDHDGPLLVAVDDLDPSGVPIVDTLPDVLRRIVAA